MIPSTIETLIDQLRIARILLSRSLVQEQIGALVLVLVTARLLEPLLHRLIEDNLSEEHARFRSIHYLYWPLLALGLGWVSAEIFFKPRIPALNLYNNLLNSLWVLLIYRLAVTFIYRWINPALARRYNHWLLIPLSVFFLAVAILRVVIGSIATVQAIQLITLGSYTVTVGIVFSVLLTCYITVVASWILQDVLYRLIAPLIEEADAGAVHSINMIGRYAVIGIGFLFVLRALGLNLASIAIIGGGLSVGIGFGLQQIVANFFAGIILLFEQALRPGDVIKLENEIGIVEKLNIRSTVVRTYDNVEVIVPNERFLTSRLISYTKSDRLVRLSLPVGASYDSNPEQVEQVLLEAVRSHKEILSDPEPIIFFKGFGDSSLDFSVTAWIDNPRRMPFVLSDLHFAIWKHFEKYRIEIPFPQHDLNLRRGWEQGKQ